jgi:hypothetical protein
MVLARARESRERVIAGLSEHFAHDVLDLDEFERRVTLAQTSESPEEIQALLADLPPLAAAAASSLVPAPVPAPTQMVPAAQVRDHQTMFAIMSGTDRKGAWSVPRRMRIVALMSGTRLDFREARFPPGPVDIEIFAMMSGTEIIVPPGLAVETHGSAIMGGFAEVNRTPASPDPEAPLLRVHGFVMMGGVDIRMQLPGESDDDEVRRRRRQRRDARDEERALRRARRHQ